MNAKLLPALLSVVALAAGCDAPGPERPSEPTVVESVDATEEALEELHTTADSWDDPEVDETGCDSTGHEAEETSEGETEGPGCYYLEGLYTEVAALRQVHLQEVLDCDDEHPLDEVNYETQYWYNGLCKFEADWRLVRNRENAIEDCFDEDTQWLHEDYCATRLGAMELNTCVNGGGRAPEDWDACWVLRDARYDDAMASGECDL